MTAMIMVAIKVFWFVVVFFALAAAQAWLVSALNFTWTDERAGEQAKRAIGVVIIAVSLVGALWLVLDPPKSFDCPADYDRQGVHSSC
jgi:FtsH-binding integral membrane protein